MTRLILVTLVCVVLPDLVFALPAHSPRPGGLAVLTVDAVNAKPAPVVMFGDRRALVLRADDKWVAIVGIPLNQPIGNAEAIVRAEDRDPRTIVFEVKSHAYREQRLTVSKSYVDLTEEQLIRVGGLITDFQRRIPASGNRAGIEGPGTTSADGKLENHVLTAGLATTPSHKVVRRADRSADDRGTI